MKMHPCDFAAMPDYRTMVVHDGYRVGPVGTAGIVFFFHVTVTEDCMPGHVESEWGTAIL